MDQGASDRHRRGRLAVSTAERRALFGDIDLALTAREFDILALLARRPGWVLSPEQLAGNDYVRGASPYAVNVHISHLRSKLTDAGAPSDLVETVRGVGWRLTCETVEEPMSASRTTLAGRCIADARRSSATWEYERAVALLDRALGHIERSHVESPRRERVCSAILERRGAARSALDRPADARRDYEEALERRPRADHLARARLHTRIAYVSLRARHRGVAESALVSALGELGQIALQDRGYWRAWAAVQLQRALTACVTDLPLWNRETGAEVQAVIETFGSTAQKAKYHLAKADMLMYETRWVVGPECLGESRLAVDYALRTDSVSLQALAAGQLGSSLVLAGEYAEAEVRLLQTIDLSRRCRDTMGVQAATMFLSIAARLQGDVRRTERFSLELESMLEQHSQPEFECTTKGQLAWVALRRGRMTSAARLSEEAISLWEHDPSMSQSVWIMAWPATCSALQAGDIGRAFECVILMTRADQQVLAREMNSRLAGAVSAYRAGDPSGETLLRQLEKEARELGYA